MKTNETGKVYRLAAQQRGDKLSVDISLRDRIREECLSRIESIRHRGLNCDERAFAVSVEWERMGNYMAYVGWTVQAVRAYREAALSCLDGTYYDHGRVCRPSRVLRLRFLDLFEKTEACCKDDTRLLEAFRGDSSLMSEYEQLYRSW